MFIGHNAVGFASKKLAPRTSLGWLMAAPMFLDILWPLFLVMGIERVRIRRGITALTPLDFTHYPWSHSLVMAVVWSIVFALVYGIVTKYWRGSIVLAFGVFSHWVFDFITHRADLPLYPGGPKVGLGLWNHPIGSLALEAALFAIGLLIYWGSTKARDLIGSIGMWSFVAFLAIIFILNAGGTPPPSVHVLAYSAFALYLLPLWAGWFDRHRE